MSRRSMRLVLGGYYNQSSEDDESSSVSYRESPVRLFTKRKRGGHKVASSRTSSRANSVASTASTMEPPINAEDYIMVSSLVQRRKTFLEPPSVAPAPAPSLNLAPSPRGFPSCQTSLNQAQSQSSAEYSSGYSSSEARRFKGYSGYTSLYGHRASASQSSGANRKSASASWTPPFVPAGVGKAILIAFLLLLLTFGLFCLSLLGCWHLAPLVWSTVTMTLHQPVITPTPPPVFSLPPKAMDGASVFNSALEAKMNTILTEIETLKKKDHQQKFVTEMVERLQTDLTDVRTDIRNVRVRVDSVDPLDWERRLSQQTAGFFSQVDDLKEQHTHISGRVAALEDQTATLQQQVYSVQNQPPPEPSPTKANAHLTTELKEAMAKWLHENVPQNEPRIVKEIVKDCSPPLADRMPDFALESQGASIVSTRCSETYRTRSACVTFLGIPLWYPSESPRTVIQGQPVQAGKCWAFHGAQGTLVIALSHPAHITHITLEHLPVSTAPTGRINSAPKAFSVYGMSTETEDGTFLGTFTYDQHGEPIQTFQLPNPTRAIYRYVELRVLSNWGHLKYTCVYRFRVHGHMAPSST
ncbi:SUN domain-containing protein 2 isoform X1 [Salmo salar]|uniref:SUN domain-containing protein 2-like isoform X1 n=1 Tax=Salmo salar TaxID=8030 RepID=A0ABM3C9U5_SALSA|nr:SUN domain-containing protein 2-like isoform X1 [Salmo salar]XP_045543314.1 SUN domain-containing protein 2-like isoform X1 [Salmo salar]